MRLLLVAALCLVAAGCTVNTAAAPQSDDGANPAGIAVDLTLEPGPESTVRVVESVQDEQYVVTGDTAAAVRSSLNRSGPYSPVDDRSYDAITRWGMQWSFRYRDGADSCSLQSATVEVVVVTTLPRLSSSSHLDAGTMARWHDYLDALETHEAGHVAGLRRGVGALQAAMDESPAMSTCEELGLYLNALGNAYQAALRDADVAYDTATEHGKSQGATFP
jgi:predicted secreted Zn-dependent protease